MQNPPLNPAGTSPLDTLTQQFGVPIFIALTALGLGLIVYSRFAKLDAHLRTRFAAMGAALLCMMAAVLCQIRVDSERGFIADQEKRNDAKLREIELKKGKDAALKLQYMYMPAGDSLRYFTLNNPSLAADYVWLTSLQYVSNSFRRGEKFNMLARFFHTMVDLDPHWIDAEINGGKVLSALIEEREKSEECYLYAIRQNPASWRLLYEAGLLFVMPPNDPNKMAEFSRKSVKYFEVAMLRKGFPKEMERGTNDRIARLRLESGAAYYVEAEKIMAANATAPDSPEASTLKEISKRDWLKARSMAQAAALTEGTEAFKKRFGAYPPNLDPIVKQFPSPEEFKQDAYGFPFDYDPQTGQVTSHGAKAMHAVQASHVVTDLIAIYRETNKGKAPPDLAALRDFVRKSKDTRLSPPSVMVLEAIGKTLDPVIGPLGPWTYNAEKGELVIPPEVNAKALYKHIDDFEWNPAGIVRKKKG